MWQRPKIKHGELTKWNWLVLYPEGFDLGNNTDIGAFTLIEASCGVIIGDNVQIGSHCSIYSRNTENGTEGGVVIEDDVKIGSHSLILPGAFISRGKKIRAYSVIGHEPQS